MYDEIRGIEKYPDLAKRYRAELNSLPGCSKCAKNKIIRKYMALVNERNKIPPKRRK